MSGIYVGNLSVTIAWIYHYVGRCAFTVYTILCCLKVLPFHGTS